MGDKAMKIEWRPMESAPRGGIVMLRTENGVTAGYWCGADVGWKVIGPQLGGFCVLDCLITGWHPLPDAEGRFDGHNPQRAYNNELVGDSVPPWGSADWQAIAYNWRDLFYAWRKIHDPAP